MSEEHEKEYARLIAELHEQSREILRRYAIESGNDCPGSATVKDSLSVRTAVGLWTAKQEKAKWKR